LSNYTGKCLGCGKQDFKDFAELEAHGCQDVVKEKWK